MTEDVRPIWTDDEKDIVIDRYAELGPKRMFEAKLLPGRTLGSIRRMGRRLECKYNNIAEDEKPDREERKKRSGYKKEDFGFSDSNMTLAVCGKWR